MICGDEIEGPIGRLAQLARAIGFHLIISHRDRRPTSSPVLLKAQSRHVLLFGFSLQSITGQYLIHGADRLVGRGDMWNLRK
jgi:S-DNA-T family DNA segregation ATPase FtsK/SpoIIIE